MSKKHAPVEADKWAIYALIDYFVAVVLAIVTVTSAEPPRSRVILERQQAQQESYPARGFRPAGPAFNLPLRSQKQQFPPTPAASYGPPPQEYGPPAEPTTTEIPTTTETIETTTLEPQAENFRVAPASQKLTNAPRENQVNPAAFYVIVPQTQNLVYATVPSTSAKLVAQVEQPRPIPVQAVPAFAKIQEIPQFAQVVEYQAFAPVATVPVASSAYTSIVNTPYSSTFIQSFQ